MATYKIGATVQIVIEFTEDEFAAIYPNDEFTAEAEITGGAEYPLAVTWDIPSRTALLRAETSNWSRGRYKCDIRVVKNGVTAFIPLDEYITFDVIAPVTEAGTIVNT